MNVSIEPMEEWKQVLRDAWRIERDYFYDLICMASTGRPLRTLCVDAP